ncbi:4'-phosphopantetheinyl transferase family protein [Oceanobacillus polygoni]|uniref:4'-phosphopantetheinyl transferase n=1 Tax=Oceanobacillus polygoni TaxID=1235259 RepID=A0A9X0YU94_9BACI|nr:4'-phosphopantetheinyl transferase superfamily protein [Oceanobacillus polygoni]MBP2077294.1 4'-phosphopantetheinyl transferase [Oceanobacillus polygoni]
MVEVFICRLPEEKSQSDLTSLLTYVSDESQKRILKFFHLADAYRTLVGELLIKHVLYKQTGKRVKDITIGKNAYGKPYFPDYPSIQFNISHSGDFVVCAVNDQQVGIDVEKVKAFDLCMAKQLFTEFEYWEILAAENKSLACYDFWTMKESYVKALGKGLAIPLHSFRVKKTKVDHFVIIDMDRNEEVKDFMLKQFTIATGYKLAVCARDASEYNFCKHPDQISFNHLCNAVI